MQKPLFDFARLRDKALLAILVLLPWQTRFIKEEGRIAGIPWEQGTVSLYALEVLVLAALLCHVLSAPKAPGAYRKEPPAFLRFWALAILYGLVSVLWAIERHAALFTWFHLFEGFALAYLLWNARLPLATLLGAFVIGMVPAAVLGLGGFFTQLAPSSSWLGLAAHPPDAAGVSVIETTTGRYLRAYGPLPHPNVFGGYMAAALLSGIALAAGGVRRRWRAALLVASVLFVGALSVSFSRSAWLAALLTVFPLALYASSRWESGAASRLKKAVGVQLVAVAAVLLMLSPLFGARVASDARLERRSIGERSSSVYDGAHLFVRHAAGVGLGNMISAAHDEVYRLTGRATYQPAHLVPALVAAELGLFGLLLFLGAVGFWAWEAAAAFRTAAPMRQAVILLPILPIVVGLFDHYPFDLFPGTLLAGLAFGMYLKAAEPENP